MSDTVLLAIVTGVVTIACAIIAHLDRHALHRRGELVDELTASELVKHNAS